MANRLEIQHINSKEEQADYIVALCRSGQRLNNIELRIAAGLVKEDILRVGSKSEGGGYIGLSEHDREMYSELNGAEHELDQFDAEFGC